jgi:hypothetical protein
MSFIFTDTGTGATVDLGKLIGQLTPNNQSKLNNLSKKMLEKQIQQSS